MMGIFSGITDLAAIIVLIIAIVRLDFCLAMTYVIISLFEIFSLVIVLGYYLQTDFGKNAPSQGGSGEESIKSNPHQAVHSRHNQGHKSKINILFRGLFDSILKLKYSFY
jgi:hypothetical protein